MISFTEIGLNSLSGYAFELKDCFTGEYAGRESEFVDVKLGPGDCKVYLAKLVKVK